MKFDIYEISPSTVLWLYTEKDTVHLDPPYQREGDIWTEEKRQLLIDSVLNGYDIPKIYFHHFDPPKKAGSRRYRYAIIDGKQRLQSIWSFIDGDFCLSEDFVYLRDITVKAAGLSYLELGRKYPKLKIRFDSYPLPIIAVRTNEIEQIEEMFSRLNEAVPLNAAEKRNAFGGSLPPTIRSLARNRFFVDKLPFGNKRYRHYDLAAKFLLIEARDKIVDTKKIYLDEFVREAKKKCSQKYATQLENKATNILNPMTKVFTKKDKLLQSIGMLVLYYYLFRRAKAEGWLNELSRKKFIAFENKRQDNRRIAEEDIARADYNLLEFDRYVQSPNDAYAMALRLSVVLKYLGKPHSNLLK